MHLIVNGRTFDVGQLGPDFVILRDPSDHPPAEAEITFSIGHPTANFPVQVTASVNNGQESCTSSFTPH